MIVETARRAFSALSDVTIGTAIVLVHITLAERQRVTRVHARSAATHAPGDEQPLVRQFDGHAGCCDSNVVAGGLAGTFARDWNASG
jgi:hypothetical protein